VLLFLENNFARGSCLGEGEGENLAISASISFVFFKFKEDLEKSSLKLGVSPMFFELDFACFEAK
jgi:hypothetical protein